jgi:hypothetical protein
MELFTILFYNFIGVQVMY